ncbi:hypothetical protein H696_01780 [Fonticula alba]|uniref:Uncharacterized protein n=1 Tax=Fonticula alba TaxID=691883 RepID=A0A058ZD97_FONAL|nr:hypothetical protein H696_01780 [Fonticula alba]KCV72385.1 hypothetical protein H696_01780 [Fonticula alba]|eukprot:XP_009493963.1 hypothetical protein H696_01780 [Fonticula alba]
MSNNFDAVKDAAEATIAAALAAARGQPISPIGISASSATLRSPSVDGLSGAMSASSLAESPQSESATRPGTKAPAKPVDGVLTPRDIACNGLMSDLRQLLLGNVKSVYLNRYVHPRRCVWRDPMVAARGLDGIEDLLQARGEIFHRRRVVDQRIHSIRPILYKRGDTSNTVGRWVRMKAEIVMRYQLKESPYWMRYKSFNQRVKQLQKRDKTGVAEGECWLEVVHRLDVDMFDLVAHRVADRWQGIRLTEGTDPRTRDIYQGFDDDDDDSDGGATDGGSSSDGNDNKRASRWCLRRAAARRPKLFVRSLCLELQPLSDNEEELEDDDDDDDCSSDDYFRNEGDESSSGDDSSSSDEDSDEEISFADLHDQRSRRRPAGGFQRRTMSSGSAGSAGSASSRGGTRGSSRIGSDSEDAESDVSSSRSSLSAGGGAGNRGRATRAGMATTRTAGRGDGSSGPSSSRSSRSSSLSRGERNDGGLTSSGASSAGSSRSNSRPSSRAGGTLTDSVRQRHERSISTGAAAPTSSSGIRSQNGSGPASPTHPSR